MILPREFLPGNSRSNIVASGSSQGACKEKPYSGTL